MLKMYGVDALVYASYILNVINIYTCGVSH